MLNLIMVGVFTWNETLRELWKSSSYLDKSVITWNVKPVRTFVMPCELDSQELLNHQIILSVKMLHLLQVVQIAAKFWGWGLAGRGPGAGQSHLDTFAFFPPSYAWIQKGRQDNFGKMPLCPRLQCHCPFLGHHFSKITSFSGTSPQAHLPNHLVLMRSKNSNNVKEIKHLQCTTNT